MQSVLLSDKLQDCYNETDAAADDDLRVYCPVIGEAYVARYNNKLWYRALVIGEALLDVCCCNRSHCSCVVTQAAVWVPYLSES